MSLIFYPIYYAIYNRDMNIYDTVVMTLTSSLCLLKVIHRGHAVTQAHRPTAAEMRVTFGSAVKCTSAARWDTSCLAP